MCAMMLVTEDGYRVCDGDCSRGAKFRNNTVNINTGPVARKKAEQFTGSRRRRIDDTVQDRLRRVLVREVKMSGELDITVMIRRSGKIVTRSSRIRTRLVHLATNGEIFMFLLQMAQNIHFDRSKLDIYASSGVRRECRSCKC